MRTTAILALLAFAAGMAASATQLRDAELVAGGSPVMESASGTVRLEDARLGRVGPTVFVPEPSALWQLGSGVGLSILLARRRASRSRLRRVKQEIC
jgi:hypothetical protein